MTDRGRQERAERFMRRALVLARRARGRTWPNPMVGAVVARGDRVVGEGYHHRAGLAHAEVEALRVAGPKARGADLYVTLEPCHHFGRTPPCTDAVARAGIRRVFVGACDPNPRECGAGMARLEDLGLEVVGGILENACLDLNEAYNVFILHGRPHVTVKVAASLDGRLAPRSGDARWISGKESRTFAHRLRARNQAVLVGSGTVLQDDPALNVRHVQGRDPTVVILDGRLRTPAAAHLFGVKRRAPVWIYTSRRASAAKARSLQAAGAEVIRVAASRGQLDLPAVLGDLLRRGVHTVLVEGGAAIIGSLISNRLVDRLEMAQAACLLGSDGVPLARFRGPARVAQAPRLQNLRYTRRGDDLHLSGQLFWPAGGEG